MKSILAVLIVVVLSSCSAQWHLNRAVEKDPNIVKSTVLTLKEVHRRDTLVVFSKTVLLQMPHDTARIDSIVIKDTTISFGPIVKKQGIITLSVKMNMGRLIAFATVDSTMIYNLRDSIRLKNALVDRQNTIIKSNTYIVDKYEGLLKKIRLAKRIAENCSYILIPLVIFFLYRKFKKLYF